MSALQGKVDLDELSFVHAVRVIKRKPPTVLAFPSQPNPEIHEAVLAEIMEVRVSSSRGRHNPRAVKRKVSKFPTHSRAKGTRPRRTQIRVSILM